LQFLAAVLWIVKNTRNQQCDKTDSKRGEKKRNGRTLTISSSFPCLGFFNHTSGVLGVNFRATLFCPRLNSVVLVLRSSLNDKFPVFEFVYIEGLIDTP